MPDKERVADAVVLLLRGDDDKPCSVLESRNDDVLVSFRSETTLPLLPLRRCCPPRCGLFSARCEALEGGRNFHPKQNQNWSQLKYEPIKNLCVLKNDSHGYVPLVI